MFPLGVLLLLVAGPGVEASFGSSLMTLGRNMYENAMAFTRQKPGAIRELPATTSPVSQGQVEGYVIHTWRHDQPGYQLQVSLRDDGLYLARLLHGEQVLQSMQVGRIDGELTKSITVVSPKSKSRQGKHVIKYRVSLSCVQREYTPTPGVDGGFTRSDTSCATSSGKNLPRAVLRKNGWHWGEKKERKGVLFKSVTGAIERLPHSDEETSTENLVVLHRYINRAQGYVITLKMKKKKTAPEFYIDLTYKEIGLERNIKITRFDDDMLNSVLVWKPMGPPMRGAPNEGKTYKVEYRLRSGCVERIYKFRPVANGPRLSGVRLGYDERRCPRTLGVTSQTLGRILNQMSSLEHINGWAWD